ncbi:MAG TPA: TerC/Alx family metal homeostasis membrane protein [Acidobacteriaceae bacterium]|nr:TerC/Alx family metal homeostasis membrane protein [Acidobacteriaceae bacterium]
MTPTSYWIYFHVALVALLGVEYLVHLAVPDARRKAMWAMGMWVGAALLLAVVLSRVYGATGGTQFLAGYAVEQVMSLDNLFVFLLLFGLFRIPPAKQPKVLYWGVAGAVVLRGLFVASGVGLLNRFHWIEYVFGALLLVAAVRLLKPEPSEDKPERTPGWLKWLTKWHPISENQDHFLVVENGQRMATVMLLALVAVEFTDVVFALDSIPAVLSITRHPFLAYTSNIMAVMGLRSLYVLLAAGLSKLRYLHFGLAAVLGFAALKMLLADWVEIGPGVSLAVIAGLMAVTVGVSMVVGRKAVVSS